MIIDHTYFTAFLTRIGGIDTQSYANPNPVSAQIVEDVNQLIADLEPKFLADLLGADIAEKIDDYPDIIGMLKNEENKTSPIANYVFFFYLRIDQTKNTGAGEKVKAIEQSRIAQIRSKSVSAWNNMVDECFRLSDKIKTSYPIKPNYKSDIFFKVNLFDL